MPQETRTFLSRAPYSLKAKKGHTALSALTSKPTASASARGAKCCSHCAATVVVPLPSLAGTSRSLFAVDVISYKEDGDAHYLSERRVNEELARHTCQTQTHMMYLCRS